MSTDSGAQERDHEELIGALANYLVSTRYLAQLTAQEMRDEPPKGANRLTTLVNGLERCRALASRAGYGDGANDLASKLGEICDLGRSLAVAGNHTLALTIAGRVLDLEEELRTLTHTVVTDAPIEGTQAVMSRPARKIVSAAACLLPMRQRRDKSEEFAAELHDMALAGASRRDQLGHALRVLVYILPLRRTLSSSRHRAVDWG